jgi:hypothetical protein
VMTYPPGAPFGAEQPKKPRMRRVAAWVAFTTSIWLTFEYLIVYVLNCTTSILFGFMAVFLLFQWEGCRWLADRGWFNQRGSKN